MRWICASTCRGVSSTVCARSRRGGLISNASAGTWKPGAERGQQSPDGSAPLPASIGTPWRKSCSTTHPQSTCGGRGLTTNRMRSGSTVTRSARCWSPPASAPAPEHALISLLAINGLRIFEALGADIDALGLERGHRTLTIVGKGRKVVTIPLAPRTARAIDLAIGERLDGPIFLRPDGHRMDRHCASRIVRRVTRRAGVDKPIGRTPCGTPSSPPPSTPASRYATSKKPPPTPTREPPCATTEPEAPSTGTPPTSSPPTSPAPLNSASPHAGRDADDRRARAVDLPARNSRCPLAQMDSYGGPLVAAATLDGLLPVCTVTGRRVGADDSDVGYRDPLHPDRAAATPVAPPAAHLTSHRRYGAN